MTIYAEYLGGGDAKVEQFEYHIPGEPQALVWNITKARYLIRFQPLQSVLCLQVVSPEEMNNILERNEWDPAHAATSDPSLPGIASPLIWEGAILYQLIDGVHRCARARELGLPFKAHLLTDAAARACYTGPPRYLP